MQNSIQTEPVLYEIDGQLNELVQKIELLGYINPVNIAEQKELFFRSKYLKEPTFQYPDIDFDRFSLHKKLFNLPIEKIEDRLVRNLYEDIIYFYSGLIQCIEFIGTGKRFYYNSLKSFGTPTEQDVKNAEFVLHFKNKTVKERDEPKYVPEQAAGIFKDYAARYGFVFNIKYSDKMSAIAMVLNNIESLVLNKAHIFSEGELGILTNHEIGVHMVTTKNAQCHPLKIFSHGFPNNVETQEGLAVFAEYMSGNLTLTRLQQLAFRVIAVDTLAKGYGFHQTFRLLHNQYGLNKEMAFNITLRVHRGGGFTKDHLYLSGLKKVYRYYKTGNSLDNLLTGKVSLSYENEISYLIANGYAVPPKYITDAFAKNDNTDKTVAFILGNLV